MDRGVRRWVALLAMACLVVAACTSETSGDDDASESDADAGGESASASDAPGVTDDTIKISLIASDLAALSEQNLAPEIGNAQKTLEAVVADINANGGVAGPADRVGPARHRRRRRRDSTRTPGGKRACRRPRTTSRSR